MVHPKKKHMKEKMMSENRHKEAKKEPEAHKSKMMTRGHSRGR
jgi:hypothetical protein